MVVTPDVLVQCRLEFIEYTVSGHMNIITQLVLPDLQASMRLMVLAGGRVDSGHTTYHNQATEN